MSTPAGTHIGPFRIIELVGAGAMGVVYRAHDPRLRREVAVKILPPAFASDPDRLARFEQEALAVARLAHPNILAIHDIGHHDGTPYMVAELLAGQTLRQKIAERRLPLRAALDYAIQIANGLAAAHAAGVVHRDIKPDNLFITPDDHVKILDFGIAKLTEPRTDAATATETVQELGPMGTAAYMSPEQARGGRADHRSDLFSLGVVIYEMLSGVSPFKRETGAESMAAVLQDDPAELSDPVNCPPALARIVRRLLAKDPSNRFQHARDLVFDLEGVVEAPDPGQRREKSPRRTWMALAAFAAVAAGVQGGFLLGRRAQPAPSELRIAAVRRLTDFTGIEEFPAIAPDLKAVAFTARVDGYRQIFVRLLGGGTPLQVTKGAADHELPRWSPDASTIVYFTPAGPGVDQGTTWQIPALGGPPRRVLESVGGCDVGRDGRLACFRLAGGKVELVAASPDGAETRVITRFDEPDYYKYPRWSPDGRWIAYQRGDGFRWSVFALRIADGAARQLTHEPLQVHGLSWLPDNSGLVISSSLGASLPYLPTLRLWEVRLDGGHPRPVGPSDLSYLHPDVDQSGAIVASRLRMQVDLWSFPTEAGPLESVQRAVRLTSQTGQVQTPTVGATDREVAFLSDSGGHANLWVIDRETGELRQLTHERERDVAVGVPVWSPDGRRIAFVSSRGNSGLAFGIWVVNPDGGNLRNLAPRGFGMTWSPDGQTVYYVDDGVVYKTGVDGGTAIPVRPGRVRNVVAAYGGTLYFMVDRTLTDGSTGLEIHAAAPEDGPSRVVARIAATRAPQWQIIQPSLSADGAWLAMPLSDGETTNIWSLSTSTGEWRQVTDFGSRPTYIARRVSWSTDRRAILAAVGDGDADIVLLEPARPR